MDRHLPGMPGLRLGAIAQYDFDPACLQVDVLAPKTPQFARLHAGESQPGILDFSGTTGHREGSIDLFHVRSFARLKHRLG